MRAKTEATGRDLQRDDNLGIEHDERMVPHVHKGHEIYGEHVSRYEAATELVAGKTVLDVASGSGYGTALLARTAKQVYGVDISQNAVDYATAQYGAANIEFITGAGDDLPLDDASVDVVVSFETIEHIAAYKTFLSEVTRVLKSDGMFIVSTPNDLEFTPGNHFHLHQFGEDELTNLLRKQFKHVVKYYQTTWVFSMIGDKSSYEQEWQQPVTVMQTTPASADKVLYFYFVCSNKPIRQPIATQGAIGEHWSERTLHERNQRAEQTITDLSAALEEQAKAYHNAAERVHMLTTELKGVYDSKSWKLMRRAAAVGHRVKVRRRG
jgi:ubiquinone/menaquinone biosynthesis C-methylase UbiE/uncharacterized coiled-coil protein SlyX